MVSFGDIKMIDKRLHEQTKYRIPQLRKQFAEVEKQIGSYILLEKCWDGYDANAITFKIIKQAIKVLDEIQTWFEKNIGFLNNRSFFIDVTPNSSGHIHIDVKYVCYSLDVYIKNDIELSFTPHYRYDINGEHTIADRATGLLHSKDIMNKKFHGLKNISIFLDEAFYKHKWKF